jgi:hypothetical protein
MKFSQSKRDIDEYHPPVVLRSSGETGTPKNSSLSDFPGAHGTDENGGREPKRQRVTRISLLSNPSSPVAPNSSLESKGCALWHYPVLYRLPLNCQKSPFRLRKGQVPSRILARLRPHRPFSRHFLARMVFPQGSIKTHFTPIRPTDPLALWKWLEFKCTSPAPEYASCRIGISTGKTVKVVNLMLIAHHSARD